MQEKGPLKDFLEKYIFERPAYHPEKQTVLKARSWLRYWPVFVTVCSVIVVFVIYLVIIDNPSQKISHRSQESPAGLSAVNADRKLAGNSIIAGEYAIDSKPEIAPVGKVTGVAGIEPSLPSDETDETPELMVTGIIYGENNPSAVIGDRLVHEGDTVSGATVVKINREGVEFEKEGVRWIQAVKQTPAPHWD
jgi:type II secretory pathway component PulC